MTDHCGAKFWFCFYETEKHWSTLVILVTVELVGSKEEISSIIFTIIFKIVIQIIYKNILKNVIHIIQVVLCYVVL